MNNSSLVSKGVSPPRHKAQPPISGKKIYLNNKRVFKKVL